MDSVEQFFKIIISVLGVIGPVIGYIFKAFPYLFYKNKINMKKGYYSQIKNNSKFKKEIIAVSDDIDYMMKCEYYGNVNPLKHKIIPLLKYYGVTNTIQKSSTLAKYLTINDNLKKVTFDVKNNIGMIIFFLVFTIIFFLACLYYLTKEIDGNFDYIFSLIFVFIFFFSGIFFLCILLNVLTDIWDLRKTVNKNTNYMQKIYQDIVEMDTSH